VNERCSHSLSRRLSRKLALLTMLVLGGLSLGVYMSVKMFIIERNAQALEAQCQLFTTLLRLEASNGGDAAVLARLTRDASMRAESRLELWWADGRPFYADPARAVLADSRHVQAHDFTIELPNLASAPLQARYTVDYTRDAQMGQRWTWILILTTLAAGALVALGAGWHVRRALQPVRDLAAQTREISAQRLDQRLALADPAEELRPLIDQFNALMQRLEQAYRQLEAFNADVAHELRTPLAALIGHTELALSRERSSESMRETMSSNLEELHRLSAMVNDMLFLASADRGVSARRGAATSLAALARDVVEFHEAPLEESSLQVRIEGDAALPVDEPLVKRALSNLLGNATRYAERGSTVVVRIGPAADRQVQVEVENRGPSIEPALLPRLFDRFFRADTARSTSLDAHHGLGLAIVAAIARMHGGQPLARSEGNVTRIGFTLTAPSG
jgi:two-component system, OmpR family, heavy metal sensor histidine kinase CusS